MADGAAPHIRQRGRFSGALLVSLLLHAALLWGVGSWLRSAPGEVAVVMVELQRAQDSPQSAADAALPDVTKPHPVSVPAPPSPTVEREASADLAAENATPLSLAAAVSAPAVAASVAEVAAATPDHDALEQAHNRYLAELLALIEAHKNYPLMARKLGQQGTVTVLFHLDHDGGVRECRLEASSGFRTLDRAALSAVEEVGHFPPLPELLGSSRQFLVAIAFTLR